MYLILCVFVCTFNSTQPTKFLQFSSPQNSRVLVEKRRFLFSLEFRLVFHQFPCSKASIISLSSIFTLPSSLSFNFHLAITFVSSFRLDSLAFLARRGACNGLGPQPSLPTSHPSYSLTFVCYIVSPTITVDWSPPSCCKSWFVIFWCGILLSVWFFNSVKLWFISSRLWTFHEDPATSTLFYIRKSYIISLIVVVHHVEPILPLATHSYTLNNTISFVSLSNLNLLYNPTSLIILVSKFLPQIVYGMNFKERREYQAFSFPVLFLVFLGLVVFY